MVSGRERGREGKVEVRVGRELRATKGDEMAAKHSHSPQTSLCTHKQQGGDGRGYYRGGERREYFAVAVHPESMRGMHSYSTATTYLPSQAAGKTRYCRGASVERHGCSCAPPKLR